MIINKLNYLYLFVAVFVLSACSHNDKFDKNNYQALYSTVVASNNCLNDYIREYFPLALNGAAVIEYNKIDKELIGIPGWTSGYIDADMDYNSLMKFDLISNLIRLNQDSSLSSMQKDVIAVGFAVIRYYQKFIQEVNYYDGFMDEIKATKETRAINQINYDSFFENLYMDCNNLYTKAGSIINDSIPQTGDDLIDTCAVDELIDTVEMQARLNRCLDLCREDYESDMTLAIAGAVLVSLVELVALIAASPSAAAALAAVLWGGEGTFLGVSLDVISIRNHYASCQDNCHLQYSL